MIESVSLLTGLVSIVLAVFAIWFSKAAERESRENYENTKDVLAEIDKRAMMIDRTVSENQQELLSTVTSLLRETVIPPKVDMEEQLGMAFIQTILSDPEKGAHILSTIQPFIEQSEKQQNRQGGR